MLEMLEKKRKIQYKYPFYLLGFYLTCLLSTVCLANRFTMIGPLLEPGGIFVFPLTFTICDIVGEVYGYAYPRMFIWIGIAAEFLFSLITIVVSHAPASTFLLHPEAYKIVFDPTFHYVLSGVSGFFVGEFLNIFLLAKWKIRTKGKWFMLRSLLCTAVGQASLTIVVDTLNFSSRLDLQALISLMMGGYAWKMICTVLMVFPSWLLVRWLKEAENIDYYDILTNFNPFKINLNDELS